MNLQVVLIVTTVLLIDTGKKKGGGAAMRLPLLSNANALSRMNINY
jgi:hypothetical protein